MKANEDRRTVSQSVRQTESETRLAAAERERLSPRCSLKVEGTQTEPAAACSPSAERRETKQSDGANGRPRERKSDGERRRPLFPLVAVRLSEALGGGGGVEPFTAERRSLATAAAHTHVRAHTQ